MQINSNMTKQRTLLVFLPLFLIVGNLFCLDNHDWIIDPSCPTTIESKNEGCDELVNHPDDDCPSYSILAELASYKQRAHNTSDLNSGAGGFCLELVSNNEFDNNDNDWNFSTQSGLGAAASLSINNNSELSGVNSAYVNVSNSTGTDWHVQLHQDGKTLDAAITYVLSFDAKADANRSINVSLQERGPSDWTNYWFQSVSLTTSMQSFSYEFVPSGSSAGNAGVMFNLGGSATNLYIDNVSFKEKCDAAEDCGNGIDDDGDGFTDSIDPDCACQNTIPNIDFSVDANGNALSRGTIVSETWAAWGVHISTHNSTDHPPMILDSNAPDFDDDLGTPHEDFGGPGEGDGGKSGELGENNAALGNVLIISMNGNTSAPNDRSRGGTITFDFDVAVDVASLTLLDMDLGAITNKVIAYDGAGNVLVERSITALGDNSVIEVVELLQSHYYLLMRL